MPSDRYPRSSVPDRFCTLKACQRETTSMPGVPFSRHSETPSAWGNLCDLFT